MINVFGHLNPDSNSVCTAAVTADSLNRCNSLACTRRLSGPTHETRYILEAARLTLPSALDIPLKDEPVWLFDFTKPVQEPTDLPQSNIVGIIDHHRLGALIIQLPPVVWIKPLGCCEQTL